MEDPIFVKFLIGFTISDDETRGMFEEMLEKIFNGGLRWVNESMFALTGGDLSEVRKMLKNICDKVEKEVFDIDDFVTLYYAAHLADYTQKGTVDKLIEERIR